MKPSTTTAAAAASRQAGRRTERQMASHVGRHGIHNSAAAATAAADADRPTSDVDLRDR